MRLHGDAELQRVGVTRNDGVRARPARALTATADVGALPAGTRAEWDVTPLVSGDGNVTLVVGPTPTTDGVFFSSREATTVANRPQLIITT